MKTVQRPNKCAQCGRSYTKAQWRRNDFWCPTCKKFVCHDCVEWGLVCPACGTKTSRNIKKGASFGAGLGTTFVLLSVFVLALSSFNLEGLYFVWVWMAIGTPLIFASVILYVLNRKQVGMHEEHLSRLPSGTIPLEKRAGHGDLSAQSKWREANRARSLTGAGAMKDTYPDHIYEGLVGNWDLPVMTKQERVYITVDIQKKALVYSTGMIALGLLITLLGVFAVQHYAVLTFGVVFCLVGSLGVLLVFYAKRVVKSDAQATVKVVWKTVGFKTAKAAVEAFLREQDLKGELKTKKLPMWEHPEHTYELPDGNKISFTYSEDRSGHVYGWVAIAYKPSGALAARKLQRELDGYLSERDLIWRVGI